jgi:hypothetical protein
MSKFSATESGKINKNYIILKYVRGRDWIDMIHDKHLCSTLLNTNRPSGSTQDGEFHVQMNDYQLFKKDSKPVMFKLHVQ